MADSQEPQIAKDEGTQEMLSKAQQDFPNLDPMEAVQQEAAVGEGRGMGAGLVQGVKNVVSEAADKVKDLNPATRDMREKHC